MSHKHRRSRESMAMNVVDQKGGLVKQEWDVIAGARQRPGNAQSLGMGLEVQGRGGQKVPS